MDYNFSHLTFFTTFVQKAYSQVVFTNNLYQVLLGVYLCQRWIVEFKGIMQPVLFIIFFLHFVTPHKLTFLKVVSYLL